MDQFYINGYCAAHLMLQSIDCFDEDEYRKLRLLSLGAKPKGMAHQFCHVKNKKKKEDGAKAEKSRSPNARKK